MKDRERKKKKRALSERESEMYKTAWNNMVKKISILKKRKDGNRIHGTANFIDKKQVIINQ